MEYVALALLFALVIAGVPVALALIGSALVSVVIFAPDLLPGAPLQVMSTATNCILLAIPLFIMAGEIAIRGKLIEPLIDLTRALLAPVPGGAGAATVISCMFFAGMTGSTAAEAAAVGTFGLPILKRSGYPAGFSTLEGKGHKINTLSAAEIAKWRAATEPVYKQFESELGPDVIKLLQAQRQK